jgi:hypothetical protein
LSLDFVDSVEEHIPLHVGDIVMEAIGTSNDAGDGAGMILSKQEVASLLNLI